MKKSKGVCKICRQIVPTTLKERLIKTYDFDWKLQDNTDWIRMLAYECDACNEIVSYPDRKDREGWY